MQQKEQGQLDLFILTADRWHPTQTWDRYHWWTRKKSFYPSLRGTEWLRGRTEANPEPAQCSWANIREKRFLAALGTGFAIWYIQLRTLTEIASLCSQWHRFRLFTTPSFFKEQGKRETKWHHVLDTFSLIVASSVPWSTPMCLLRHIIFVSIPL